MLTQILRDMYVDPEILAELDEEQKQILFVRMREEQVKRWKERESELDCQEKLNPSKPRLKKVNAKSVNYLIAKDGNPWVWVLGEDEEENNFSKILEEMEKRDDEKDEKRAKELAHKEAEERLKKKQAEEEAERERELRELKELREKEEKVAQEKAKLEAEMKRLEEEARIAARQAEEDRRRLEQKRKEEEKKRQEALRRGAERKREEEKRKEEDRKKRERELAHQKAEEAWKRAKEKAAEEQLEEEKKQREAEEKMREEERRRREEERRRQEELARLKAAEEARIKREQEAKLKAKKLEEERKRLEEQQKEAVRKRKEELERIRAQRKAEKEQREREFEEQERTRAKEIYMTLKQVREAVKKKELEERQKEEEAWRAREKAAKEHEKLRRSSVSLARREVMRDKEMVKKRLSEVPGNSYKAAARPLPRSPSGHARPQRPPPPIPNRPSDLRDRHRLGSPVITAPPVQLPERPQRTPKPKSRQAVIEWFRNEQLPKNICYENGKILPYFHGLISRQEAEELLSKKLPGSFLVRVSERVWGYTITYRAADRCKHYLVDTSDNTYQFFGHNQIVHASLSELVQFHKMRPISGVGQELLKLPCGQSKDPPDYEELLNSAASSGDTFSTKF